MGGANLEFEEDSTNCMSDNVERGNHECGADVINNLRDKVTVLEELLAGAQTHDMK